MAHDPDWDGVMKHRARESCRAAEVIRWREAEGELSAAYVRLRKILGAFETPTAPSGRQVWEHTEQCAREAITALRATVEGGYCCERASVGKGHEVWCLASRVIARIDRFGGPA